MADVTQAVQVPMHPEVTADPSTLRWVVPLGTLPFAGHVAAAPGALGERLARAELHVATDATGVVVSLEPPLTWRGDGPTIRSELAAALARPDAWVPRVPEDEPGAAPVSAAADLDRRLREHVEAAIAGEAGEYVRSHGGDVRLLDVRDGEVVLDLQGACRGCPASTFTLQRRFEADLRRLAPGVVRVRAADG